MGTHINLLDWRAERRARRQQEFQRLMLGAAVLGIAVVLLWWMHAGRLLEAQEARNNMLRSEIQRLDAEIAELDQQQENLLARMQVIESLQSSRSASVHFFDQLVETLPDGVHLTRLQQRGEQVTIDGIAESNARVSSYMKRLDASDWFDDPRLVVIRSSERERVRQSEFTLRVKGLRAPQRESETSGDAAGEAQGDAPGTATAQEAEQ